MIQHVDSLRGVAIIPITLEKNLLTLFTRWSVAKQIPMIAIALTSVFPAFLSKVSRLIFNLLIILLK
ncbi:hypothetical protein Z042_06870 [Chania multitudinisentens RB-25]|uniref:Uncharacterized protein n=1 Tax=Chania multitudinisentens RB-25 TaxID=1441930 RepID=W0LG25_9GAMM|nr:hypothetical protein Z042_06870 [Chania multitudinisentens RB-25]